VIYLLKKQLEADLIAQGDLFDEKAIRGCDLMIVSLIKSRFKKPYSAN